MLYRWIVRLAYGYLIFWTIRLLLRALLFLFGFLLYFGPHLIITFIAFNATGRMKWWNRFRGSWLDMAYLRRYVIDAVTGAKRTHEQRLKFVAAHTRLLERPEAVN